MFDFMQETHTQVIMSLLVFTCLWLTGCVSPQTAPPTPEAPELASTFGKVQPSPPPEATPAPVQARATVELPPQKPLKLQYHHTSRNGVILSLAAFDDRRFRLIVADQPDGTGSLWQSSREAGKAQHGLAAINGGFFTPEGAPLGILITDSIRRGHLNRSSLGAGIYLSTSHTSLITRRQNFQSKPDQWGKVHHLLQSGPMLVENSRPVSGLSKQHRRPRSFIIWDGQHHWAIGRSSDCSLDELSKALAGKSPADFPIHTALNLDGGRSSDLWVGPKIPGGKQNHRGFFNKPVRNYLILKPP